MGNKRLYSLAKELGIDSKELIVKLRSKGVMVKSALSSIDKLVEDAARRVVLGDAAVVTPPVKASDKKEKVVAKVDRKEPVSVKAPHQKGIPKAEASVVKVQDSSQGAKRLKKSEGKKVKGKKTEVKKAEAKKPEVNKPEVNKPEVKKPEVKKPEVKKPEAPQPEKANIAAPSKSGDDKFKHAAISHKPADKKVDDSTNKSRDGMQTSPAGKKPVKGHHSDSPTHKSSPRGFQPNRIKPDEGGIDLTEILVSDKDVMAVIEQENRLIDIEESVKKRAGVDSKHHHVRKRLSFSGEEEAIRAGGGGGAKKGHHAKGGAATTAAQGTSRFSGKRYGGQSSEQRGQAPSGSKARNRKQKAARLEEKIQIQEHKDEVARTTLKLGDSVVVKELASYMNVSAAELVKKLMGMGVFASINQRVDFDTATLLAADYDFVTMPEGEDSSALLPEKIERNEAHLASRPPVVAVMGHVDHGKTSLLDAIRHTNVADGESGGITQHIGAYQITLPGSQVITFLDTPGHEAFTAMRAHGAQVTDIAILVVAADDGVKPQTIEAISHVKAANVPIIIALNKMDKPNANPDKALQELSQHGLLAEEWGGTTIVVKCSAKMKQGIDEILEMVVIQAEMMELRAYDRGEATGVVVESRKDLGRGAVATILVKEGLLKVGDAFVAGCVSGRVRAMEDYRGRRIQEASPAQPVEITGFNGMPDVSDSLRVVESETVAKSVAADRALRKRQAVQSVGRKPTLEELLAKAVASEVKELLIVLRADVVGSVAAVKEALEKLENEEGVKVRVIFSGTGTITESDINFASASGAVVVGFHVRPPATVVRLAQDEGIEIRLYSIIYKALEDMQDILNGMLTPKFAETTIGSVEVRAIFSVPKLGKVAGCYVTEGTVARNAEVRLIRDGVEKYIGKCTSLRRFKEDAKEVKQGFECGIRLENWQDVQEKDIIEFFRNEEIKA
jgi:translation initiation factor IF-2